MTAPVPGLSDERLAEIQQSPLAYSSPVVAEILAEVVRLREDNERLQRQIEAALGESAHTVCHHSVTVWTCSGCIAHRVRAALAIEDGQT